MTQDTPSALPKRRPRRNWMAELPPPEAVNWGGRAPWALITLRELSELFPIDRMSWGQWVYRGVAPQQVDRSFFGGVASCYRVSRIIAWLAFRRTGETRSEAEMVRAFVSELYGAEMTVSDALFAARRLEESMGSRTYERQGIRFASASAWEAYLDTIPALS